MTDQMTRLYHATSREVAADIIRNGFRDSRAGRDVDTDAEIGGVWFTSNPNGESDLLDAVIVALDVPVSVADEIHSVGPDGVQRHYGVLTAETVNQFPREAL